MSHLWKIGVIIALFILVFTLTWVVYFPYSPLGVQSANLKLAEGHEAILKARLQNLKDVEKLMVAPYTGLGGSLAVQANVPDKPTAEKIMTEVLATRPPVTVKFLFIVGETTLIQRVVQPNSAANGSQPFSLDTNRTSSAAGSRR